MSYLTRGSRVLYQGDSEIGLIQSWSGQVERDFRAFLQQRGLTVEDVRTEYVGTDWTGARTLRVYAQVITPMDRRDAADLAWDMTQDLQRATGAPVESPYLTVLVAAEKDPGGNPIYPQTGTGTQLPAAMPPPINSGPGLWDSIGGALDLPTDTAKWIAIGGAVFLGVLLLRR